MQLNRENFFLRIGKLIMLAYGLLGFAIVAGTFNESISFLDGIVIGLYVAGGTVLSRFFFFYKAHHHYPSLQEMFPLTKFDKTKVVKDILKIVACFAAVFVVMVVGTLVNPKTTAGFVMLFEAPIVIIAIIIVALIARISFTLLNIKRYMRLWHDK